MSYKDLLKFSWFMAKYLFVGAVLWLFSISIYTNFIM